MIRAVIFDMDGVLTNSEPVINEASICALREYGIHPKPEDFTPFVGTGEDRYIGGVAEMYGLAYTPEMKKRVYEIYLDILPEKLQPFPGVHELIDVLLQEHYLLAVASSADRVKVEANLEAIELDRQRFAGIVVGEDVSRKKPSPEIFLKAAEKLEVSPAECCVVEDAFNGIEAAKGAGMRCIAVAQSFPQADLMKTEADVVRQVIADITGADIAP